MPIHIRGVQVAYSVNPVVDVYKTFGACGDTLVAAVCCAGWSGDIGAEFGVGFATGIIGDKRVKPLDDNHVAVEIYLSNEELAILDEVSRLPLEHPVWMLARKEHIRFVGWPK